MVSFYFKVNQIDQPSPKQIMRLSSNYTFLLPALVLIGESYCVAIIFHESILNSFSISLGEDWLYVEVPVAILLIYFINKYILHPLFIRYNKFGVVAIIYACLFLLTMIFQFLTSPIPGKIPQYYVPTIVLLPLIIIIILTIPYTLLANRHFAYLTEDAIVYWNLLGIKGDFELTRITILEQQRNVLTFLREFAILRLIVRTDITFVDDELNPYIITIFPRSLNKRNKTFNLIKQKAEECGNHKIRQYTLH